MKKINLWLVRQHTSWKWLAVNHNHPCGDLTKCVNECLYKVAKKREEAKLEYDSTFDFVTLFTDGTLTPQERTIMMDCASAIEDCLRKERGLKLNSVSCVDDCDWVRWFTAKDLKRYLKALEKDRKKEVKYEKTARS